MRFMNNGLTIKEALDSIEKVAVFLRTINLFEDGKRVQIDQQAINIIKQIDDIFKYKIFINGKESNLELKWFAEGSKEMHLVANPVPKKKKYWKSLGDMINVFENNGCKIDDVNRRIIFSNGGYVYLRFLCEIAKQECYKFTFTGNLNIPLDLLCEER